MQKELDSSQAFATSRLTNENRKLQLNLKAFLQRLFYILSSQETKN